MSLRTLFFILITLACLAISSALIWRYCYVETIPQQPCTSVIKDGKFIDETQRPYNFNGVITWWPKTHRITLFGVRKDDSSSLVFERTILLDDIKEKGNIVHGKVKQVVIAANDQLPATDVILGEKGKNMSLIFKAIDRRSWLMMLNDNWVMMCEYK